MGVNVVIDADKCDECYECVITCPTNALRVFGGGFQHNGSACQFCEVCMDVCPECAIRIYEAE